VRLNSIHLVNFRQHADTRIDFDLGLTGIIGPNGSGKTTVLEGIAWALYGQAATRGTRESIRFMRAPARASVRVELDFELGGHRYVVSRGLTTAEVYLDGATTPIANSITSVNELLQRRLGMTKAEFFNTYFTGQKELNVMAAMGASERAQFLSRVLGYEKLRSAQTLVKERRKLITAEIAGLRSGMPDPDAVTRMLADSEARMVAAKERVADTERVRRERDAALHDLSPQWQRAQDQRERLLEFLAELRVAESEAAGLERDLERLDRELASIAIAREELERLATEIAPLSEIGEEFRHLERLAREEGKRQTLAEAERALAEELERMRERLAKIEDAPALEEKVTQELEAKRHELEETQGTLEARRTEWVRDRQEAETKRDALRRQYAEVKEQRDTIVDLGADGICPTCTRKLGDNFRTVLEQFDEQLETIAVDGRFYGGRLEQLQEMPEAVRDLDDRRRATTAEVGALERRLAKVQLAVQERTVLARDIGAKELRHDAVRRDLAAIPVGYDALRHQELRRAMERIGPLNEQATRLGAQVDRGPALSAERERVVAAAMALRAKREDVQRRRALIEFSDDEYGRLRTSYEQASLDARAAHVAATAAAGELAAARTAVEGARNARAELARTENQLEALHGDRRLHEELDRAYSDLRSGRSSRSSRARSSPSSPTPATPSSSSTTSTTSSFSRTGCRSPSSRAAKKISRTSSSASPSRR
jgi:DNA repair protein SbcC/Rad50